VAIESLYSCIDAAACYSMFIFVAAQISGVSRKGEGL
jgi:hypothetical protein